MLTKNSNLVRTIIATASLLLTAVQLNAGARLTNSPPANGKSIISWGSPGRLEMATQLSGPWLTISNAPNPLTNQITAGAQFFRLNQTVDATTLHKKVLCGYQGWFRCPGDGANQWIHWSRSTSQIASNTLTFEMWPDMSEYANKYPAPGFTYPGGAQAYLFSSQDQQTVDRHFDWMQDYGIDGVFVSRFVVGVAGHPTNVLNSARQAANRTGRTFALAYDMSGQPTNTLFNQLTNDWRWLVDTMHITQDPRYLHHNGKPVLMIWGFFSDRFSTNLANQIIGAHTVALLGTALPPSPLLTITRSGANVILTWASNAAGFTLQSTTNLFPTAWFSIAQPAVTNVGQISVTVTTTAAREFFRLKSQ